MGGNFRHVLIFTPYWLFIFFFLEGLRKIPAIFVASFQRNSGIHNCAINHPILFIQAKRLDLAFWVNLYQS